MMMEESTSGQDAGRVSVIDPISRAIDRSTEVLFRPFDLGKWIALGFCAWLATLGDCGGGSGGGNESSRWGENYGSRRDFEEGLYEAWDWILAHLVPILFIAGAVVIVAFVLWLLFLWLSSRGKFMFLDGVVHNRAAVVEPWGRFRKPANSLLFFRVFLELFGFATVILILVFAASQVWLHLDSYDTEPLLVAGLVVSALAFLVTVLTLVLIEFAINDFVVPLMYLRECDVGAAWGELGRLFSARPGAFMLYLLIRIVIGVLVTVLMFMACCMTCCIVLLPFVGTVILLPLLVFLRAYPLYFLSQFGPDYARFGMSVEAEPLVHAGHEAADRADQ